MIASAVTVTDDVGGKATNAEDFRRKVLAFLVDEFKRQCLGVDLYYSPGDGYRDEPIRTWTCENDREFFGDAEGSPTLELNLAKLDKLAALIVEIAEGEADSKSAGRHRFFVRTHQRLGARHTMSFALSPAHFGEYKEPPMSKNDGKKTGVDPSPIDPRKQLLAGMAAHIAASVLQDPGDTATSPDAVAEISVTLAEAILKRVGL